MSETRLGVLLRLMHRTYPIFLWRMVSTICVAVALILLLRGVTAALGAVGLWPGMAALLALILIAILAWGLTPLWSVAVAVPSLLALGLVMDGRLVAGRAQLQQLTDRTLTLGGWALSGLPRAMRSAHLDIIGLVQGLTHHLPRPLGRSQLLAKAWLRGLAVPLGTLAAARSLAASEGAKDLPDIATLEVALCAEQAQSRVAALVLWPAFAGLGAGLSLCVGVCLAVAWADDASGLWRLGVAVILSWAVWSALVAPVLAVWVARQSLGVASDTAPSEPWRARLEASSPAYRKLAAWPPRTSA